MTGLGFVYIRSMLESALRRAGQEVPASAEPVYSTSYEEEGERVYLTLRLSINKEAKAAAGE